MTQNTANTNNTNKIDMKKVEPVQQAKIVILADSNKISAKPATEMEKIVPTIDSVPKTQELQTQPEQQVKTTNEVKVKLEKEENTNIRSLSQGKRASSCEDKVSIPKVSVERRLSDSSSSDRPSNETTMDMQIEVIAEEELDNHKINEIPKVDDENSGLDSDDDLNDSVLIIEEDDFIDEADDETNNTVNNNDKVELMEPTKEDKSENSTKTFNEPISPLKLSKLSAAAVELKEAAIHNEHVVNKTKIVKEEAVPPTIITAINLDSDEEITTEYKMPGAHEKSSSSSSWASSMKSVHVKKAEETKAEPIDSASNLITENTTTLENPAEINQFSSSVNMLSTLNMLTWREKIGSARGTNLRFKLNEFNLVEIYERVKPRISVPAIFNRPILQRDDAVNAKLRSGQVVVDPLLYLCRRCCCHGPATEFLAPEFCSMECVKRPRKRSHAEIQPHKELQVLQKRARSIAKPIQNPLPNSNINNKSNNNVPIKDANDVNNMPTFQWVKYLKNSLSAAPINLFLNPFPTGPNRFEVDMKLEAIDPENCSLWCVCTVVEIAGYRLKLSFDGYDSMYDFWVNADSMDIFPPNWCQKTGRILQPPLGIACDEFNWHSYLAKTRGTPAPRSLFTHLNAATMPSRNPFRVGMYLEAEDLNDTGKLCVAKVADVLNERIRIHFDGWDDCYDYWVDTNSPYIHAIGWHEGRKKLVPPPGYASGSFSWPEYIRRAGGVAAPAEIFFARDPIGFKLNMKLEVVDPCIPAFIRPATVIARKGHRIKLHLDKWAPSYCFWLEDDSPDIHPISWCEATDHELEAPPGYRMRHQRTVAYDTHILGCRNVGNAKNLQFHNHVTMDECPYALQNWRYKPHRPRRIQSEHVLERSSSNPSPVSSVTLCSQNTMNSNDRIKTEVIVGKSNIEITQNNVEHGETKKSMKVAVAAGKHTTDRADVEPKTNKRKSALSQTESKEKIKKEAQEEMDVEGEIESACINKIAKEFLCDYGPRLKQSQELWQKHLANSHVTLIESIESNPLSWSTTDVATFVERILKSNSAATKFLKEDIDGGSFLQLRQSDITEVLNLPLGPALKLYSHIVNLRAICVCKFLSKHNSYN